MAKINLEESFQVPFELLGKVPVILVPLGIISVLSLILSLATQRTFSRWEILVMSLVSFVVILFGMAWVTLLLEQHFKGERVNLGETWVELSKNLGNVAIAAILITVIVSLGLFLYIVPGIILAALFFIIIPQVAVEKTTFDKSLAFMSRFVFAEKNFLPLLLYALIAFLLALIPIVGSFLNAFFLILFFPYLYLQYGREES